MADIPILQELAIIAGLGALVTVVLSKLRLPTVAGLLASGALLGPFGFGLVRDVKAIEVLAEIGVVLLLFTIGLEFSIERLRHIFSQVAVAGCVQVIATGAVTAGVAILFKQSIAQAIFYGFVITMSSTAIVLRALKDRSELDAPHGRFIVGTLVIQDLCVVPMILLVPILGGGQAGDLALIEIGLAFTKAALIMLGALVVAKFIVPRLLSWVDASRNRELFLLSILAICIGTAYLTSLAGLSLALGAFLGGMVVADTEFQHRAMGDIIPLRDAFVSIFFISLGMLFDSDAIIKNPTLVGLFLVGLIPAKALVATFAAVLMRFPPRVAWLTGVGLSQFGEFGFVLLALGQTAGLTDPTTTQVLLAAGIVSMFLTPILIHLGPHITAGEKLLAPLTRLLGVRSVDEPDPTKPLAQHVVVIGYGIAGKLVSQALSVCELIHTVLEMNAETVRRAKEAGAPVYYADATSAEALCHANIKTARMVVVLINDPQAAIRVVDTIRRVAPNIPMIVRSRYHAEQSSLLALGAAEVVAEEVEASIEVLSRLLRRLEVPRNVINARIRDAREILQTSTRKITVPRSILPEHALLSNLKIESILVTSQSLAMGQSAVGLDVRRKTRALIVAIRRGEVLLEEPDPNLPFENGDVVYLVGSGEAIRAAIEMLDSKLPDEDSPGAG